MTAQKDGGQAFPRPCLDACNKGMTLLDYFAGQALAGAMAHPRAVIEETRQRIAEICYGYAEAMLAERERRMNKSG